MNNKRIEYIINRCREDLTDEVKRFLLENHNGVLQQKIHYEWYYEIQKIFVNNWGKVIIEDMDTENGETVQYPMESCMLDEIIRIIEEINA